MNWVPKWFKPSGAWKPEQLTRALGDIFERAISSTPAAAMARDVGDLPLGDPANGGAGPLTPRAPTGNESAVTKSVETARTPAQGSAEIGASSR